MLTQKTRVGILLAKSLWVGLILLLFQSFSFAQTAAFSINDTTGCAPFSVNFTNLSSGAQTYYWDFDDGLNSSLANPSHTWWTAALALALMLAAFSTEGAAQSRNALILQQQSATTYQRRLSQASPLARPPSSGAVAPAPGLNVLNRPPDALTSKLSEERQVRPFGANLFTAGGGI